MGFARRKVNPWEVVNYKAVHPVTGYLNEDDDLDIIHVGETDTRGTYLFDVKDVGAHNIQQALVFARQQLLIEISKKGYNTLLLEGWEMTTLRKGVKRRVEVKYRARPALLSGDVTVRLPPFFDLLTSKVY
ncbi:hypothetical protein JB92DRAFT_3111080 [Gautieria morchelliformis]|nr:hypothetical protein JB92DRAFT_3111080 [Gautieria morchelliformis]